MRLLLPRHLGEHHLLSGFGKALVSTPLILEVHSRPEAVLRVLGRETLQMRSLVRQKALKPLLTYLAVLVTESAVL
jgi:hypothetical protein